jgi:hypothetical protein
VGKWKQATLEQQFASFINALQVGEGACALRRSGEAQAVATQLGLRTANK